MSCNRFLILLGVCFLAASAAWADDVGYVECSNHPEGTQVFGKPRKTPDVLESLPCGQRFTVLVYGFVFSRIETSDGKIGYIYSNLIAVDRAATSVQRPASGQLVSASERVPVRAAPVAQPAPPAPAKPQPAPTQPAASLATVPAPSESATPAPSSPALETPSPITNVSVTTATAAPVTPPDPPAPSQPQPAVAQPPAAPAPTPAPTAPASATSAPIAPAAAPSVPETTATIAQPAPPPAPPQPAPAPPVAPPIRPADARTSWERPLPSARSAPKVEVFGGFAFARMVGAGGTSSNLNGAVGSFGWNVKPWLQIIADSSYSFVNVSSTTKNVLYGNHFGPRYFHRSRNRWGATPFVEALVGGSRSDITVSGTGGYTTSDQCLSFKVGGGLDLRPSRHWEIRVFDVDYYRTSFGTNLHQNNYWASAGIVLRLFGGASDY